VAPEVDPAAIDGTADLLDALGLDSMDFLALIQASRTAPACRCQTMTTRWCSRSTRWSPTSTSAAPAPGSPPRTPSDRGGRAGAGQPQPGIEARLQGSQPDRSATRLLDPIRGAPMPGGRALEQVQVPVEVDLQEGGTQVVVVEADELDPTGISVPPWSRSTTKPSRPLAATV